MEQELLNAVLTAHKRWLNAVLTAHKRWLKNESGGVRANLRGEDLRGANLQDADLRGANLQDADLRGANLQDANLRDADLRDANLRGADLRDAYLQGANLRGADLQDADLRGVTGNCREIKSMQVENWPIVWTQERMWVGCQCMLISDWRAADAGTIIDMDDQALDFWEKWKGVLRQVVEMSL